MKSRLAILALLLAIGAWAVWRGLQPSGEAQARLPAWPVVQAGSVARVDIRVPPDTHIRLQRQGDRWMLLMPAGPVSASDRDVRHLVDDLTGMHIIRVVSRSRRHDAELGVDGKGVAVQLSGSDGKLLLNLIVGKQGSDLLSTYVRRAGAPEVVAVDKALVWQVRRTLSSWKAPAATATKRKAETHHR